MKVTDFKYELPEELIAQVPIKNRDQSRLMILHKDNQIIEDKIFQNILEYLKPGDCLVRNNTRVIPARLYGKKEETGTAIEFLLLKRLEGDIWEVMVHPRKKIKARNKSIIWRRNIKSRNIRNDERRKSKSQIFLSRYF